MAKRFTDAEKWGKNWFRMLKPEYKCFWNYICDQCDPAGVWDVDFDLAKFYIGRDLKGVEEALKKQYHEFKPLKWWIIDFCDFQYGPLVDTQNFHRSIINLLKKHGLWEFYQNRTLLSGAAEGLTSPIGNSNSKSKSKSNSNIKGIIKGKMTDDEFLEFLRSNPAYSHIDIDFELGKMDSWLLANPGRQKTRSFIVHWLNKIQKPLKTGVEIHLTKQQRSNLRQLDELMGEIKNERTDIQTGVRGVDSDISRDESKLPIVLDDPKRP